MRTLLFARRAGFLFLLLFTTIATRAQFFSGSNVPGASSDYSLLVGPATTNLSIIVPGGASGYSDLLVKRGSAPTDTSYDFISNLSGQTNAIHLETPELTPGSYFIRVRTP